ncbi:DUF1702 family protein [Micromonospora auratinigra]|uniref:Enediyne biosynthesis protein n=1 Tax=Micromonospora auratinigra TaxID=261654 RepID=A0A1A8ZGS4_9ACTN|nr:DUF1702 family protein [Micromonospora auratinigra]SBT43024.1 Protein of unknown function (DUF1702) [Micromonospora auratinigra]
MSAPWLALRRRLLTPSPKQTELRRRGFRVTDDTARIALESAGRSFVTGFGHAAGSASPPAAERLLETVDAPLRGFAYEGAAMAYALMAGLGLGDRTGEFLAGGGQRHLYMAHVGAGWALARLPRLRWRRVLPTDPLLRWLALDGYGFHQAYFRTDRYVRRQHRDPAPSWPSELRGYAGHAVDQGIGRALWFVGGADVAYVARTVHGFAPQRHGDLFSGVGLAATYAGGVADDELATLARLAGPHRAALAQGSAFAAKARLRAGLATAHTARATAALCAATPEQAATMTDDALRDLPPDADGLPAYAVWRRRIADEFTLLGRC